MFAARTDPKTPEILKQKALERGFVYGRQGATGEFLDAITSDQYVLIDKKIWESVIRLCEKVSIMKMSVAKKPPTNHYN